LDGALQRLWSQNSDFGSARIADQMPSAIARGPIATYGFATTTRRCLSYNQKTITLKGASVSSVILTDLAAIPIVAQI